jgi:hypothetical protein
MPDAGHVHPSQCLNGGNVVIGHSDVAKGGKAYVGDVLDDVFPLVTVYTPSMITQIEPFHVPLCELANIISLVLLVKSSFAYLFPTPYLGPQFLPCYSYHCTQIYLSFYSSKSNKFFSSHFLKI